MADAETGPATITDIMAEINEHRYLQYQGFKGINDILYSTTTLCVDPTNDTLHILFHDVSQPLVHYVLPIADFMALCDLTKREQTENKLPEEMAAEAAPSA